MRYSVLAPGKRLRPALCVLVGEMLGAERRQVLPSACALEMVHAFSLIHDDLPAMDDDELRRGRPTSHVAFGEAVAILAGDALACLAFETVARETPDKDLVPELVCELGRAVGTRGMIGGQILDLAAEGRPPDLDLVRAIHVRKTAALIRAASLMGAISARADLAVRETCARYGETMGLAFQVADDLLDETSTPEALGKSTRKDLERGKLTWPACAGLEASRKMAGALAEEAAQTIRPLDKNGDLAALARFVVARTF
jgi:geranylgeranyl diphosphate synthase type II